MGLMDLLAAAVPGAMAARTGYLSGQQEANDRAERQQQLAIENKRNSLMDQLRDAVDQSTITRNRAQADRAERPTVTKPTYKVGKDGTVYSIDADDPTKAVPVLGDDGQPIKAATPSEPVVPTVGPDGKPINTPRSQAGGTTPYFQPSLTVEPGAAGQPTQGVTTRGTGTGSTTPLPTVGTPRGRGSGGGGSGSSAQDRLDAKTALDEAEKASPRPSKVTGGMSSDPSKMVNPAILTTPSGTKAYRDLPMTVPNPAYQKAMADSLDYDKNVVSPLRQHLLDVTVPGVLDDSTSASTGPTSAPKRPQLSPVQQQAMQAEYDDASHHLQAVLNNPNAPAAVKQRARQLYDQHQAQIARKYGTVAGGDDQE